MSKNVSIMFSGGLDSFIMYHYALKNNFEPDLIYVDLGHPYVDKEKAAILRTGLTPIYIHMDTLYSAIEKRLSNQIIPSRNLLLATIGGMFNKRVWLGVLDGEQLGKEHDKSKKFFRDSTALLSYLNEYFQDETKVETPFDHMTKAGTIKWALNGGGIKREQLFETSSCYHPTEEKCGECLTCVKRHMAFVLNDIMEPGYTKDPNQSEYMKELEVGIPEAIKNKDYSRFTKDRANEFMVYQEKHLMLSSLLFKETQVA